MIRFALVVPVYEGQSFLPDFLDGLEVQTARPDHVIFIDSSTGAETSDYLRARGYSSQRIQTSDFDHGGTRNLGVRQAYELGCSVVVLMTQDAILDSPGSLASLLAPFSNASIGAVFGRQLPRTSASAYECANRAVRYPALDYVANDRTGSRRYFMSNAFAAYRVEALLGVGGFRSPALFGEDAIASYELQLRNMRVAYIARATVRHSHRTSFSTELRRFFDVAVSVRYAPELSQWALPSDGIRATLAEVHEVYKLGGPTAVGTMLVVVAARALGLALGSQSWLPRPIARKLSYSRAAFDRLIPTPLHASERVREQRP